MTWSPAHELAQKKRALRLLLDGGDFTRSLERYSQSKSDIPSGIWSLLENERLIQRYVGDGVSRRLALGGWIKACRLLRDEIGLDKRFGDLSKCLKALAGARNESTVAVQVVAESTGLGERWIREAIQGEMAELIYAQHGARMDSMSGWIDIPSHIGNKLSRE